MYCPAIKTNLLKKIGAICREPKWCSFLHCIHVYMCMCMFVCIQVCARIYLDGFAFFNYRLKYYSKEKTKESNTKIDKSNCKIRIFTGKCLSICSIIAPTISIANEFHATTTYEAITRCCDSLCAGHIVHYLSYFYTWQLCNCVYSCCRGISLLSVVPYIFFSCHCVRVFLLSVSV